MTDGKDPADWLCHHISQHSGDNDHSRRDLTVSAQFFRPGFEGGQTPIHRRLPKRGFNNNFRKEYVIVNLSDLADIAAGTVVDYDYVMENKLAKQVKDNCGLKVLGAGEIGVALTVKAAKFSASAKEAIEKAGGTAETL